MKSLSHCNQVRKTFGVFMEGLCWVCFFTVYLQPCYLSKSSLRSHTASILTMSRSTHCKHIKELAGASPFCSHFIFLMKHIQKKDSDLPGNKILLPKHTDVGDGKQKPLANQCPRWHAQRQPAGTTDIPPPTPALPALGHEGPAVKCPMCRWWADRPFSSISAGDTGSWPSLRLKLSPSRLQS